MAKDFYNLGKSGYSGAGHVGSMLAFNSDNPSSNPAEV